MKSLSLQRQTQLCPQGQVPGKERAGSDRPCCSSMRHCDSVRLISEDKNQEASFVEKLQEPRELELNRQMGRLNSEQEGKW